MKSLTNLSCPTMYRGFIVYTLALLGAVAPVRLFSHANGHDWQPSQYPAAKIHAPTPVPDRVILTWNADPSTTQAVTWRTDTSVRIGLAEIAIANVSGHKLRPIQVPAVTTLFASDLNEAHYHSVTFTGLQPDTLYAYRVGDGVNWSEYFHFRTASNHPAPFSFIYFGDAQNEIKTHWSRVFREAFRDAPRAAFTLHAGDLINEDAWDAEWGEWHGAPAWVNGTVPVIATPGNHEYFQENPGPENERLWNRANGQPLKVDVQVQDIGNDSRKLYRLVATSKSGTTGSITYDDTTDKIISVDDGMRNLAGYTPEMLIGTEFDKAPLHDRPQDPGTPAVSRHWRHQFAFPVEHIVPGLEETCYYIDYQGTRIISLDSNRNREEQIPWLRNVLLNNPNRWTIITFHHPLYSPARDRDNPELRQLWKPLFDEFKVDLVLNGHDHTYARTGVLKENQYGTNVPTGYQQAYDPQIGTVYVVSVSGPKMYPITKGTFAVRLAEDTQLYQIISIDGDELRYEARTALGELYDAFSLVKRDGQPNVLKEMLPPENRRTN